ncbi:MAG: hypothetical protein HYZ38_17175 [Mycobacterium sp.]|nr:hypothetical protein [Mycobacterium sp.]
MTGIALVTTGAIAVAPISAPPTLYEVPKVSTTVELSAIPYVLTLPVLRQYIENQLFYFGTWLGGWAQAGIGTVETILAVPENIVTITKQVLALDLGGAFDTFVAAVVDGVEAIGGPLLEGAITQNQKYLAVQSAMWTAIPQALISAGSGLFEGAGLVAQSVIAAAEVVLKAILPLNLSNFVDALVQGAKLVVDGLAAGGAAVVDGIETAQKTIVTALQAGPTTQTLQTRSVAPESTDLGTDSDVTTFALSVDGSTGESADTTPAADRTAAESEDADGAEDPAVVDDGDAATTVPVADEEDTASQVDETDEQDPAEAVDQEPVSLDEVRKSDPPSTEPVKAAEAADSSHDSTAAANDTKPDNAPAAEQDAA